MSAATVIYTAVVVIPMPKMIAEMAVKHNRGKSMPPERSITDCVNFRPSPETNTEPIMIPAQAHAMGKAAMRGRSWATTHVPRS